MERKGTEGKERKRNGIRKGRERKRNRTEGKEKNGMERKWNGKGTE
jgi:hypothetical protein